jgi:hypothetical protein
MQFVLLHVIRATDQSRVNLTCDITTARGRILDGFSSPIRMVTIKISKPGNSHLFVTEEMR